MLATNKSFPLKIRVNVPPSLSLVTAICDLGDVGMALGAAYNMYQYWIIRRLSVPEGFRGLGIAGELVLRLRDAVWDLARRHQAPSAMRVQLAAPGTDLGRLAKLFERLDFRRLDAGSTIWVLDMVKGTQ